MNFTNVGEEKLFDPKNAFEKPLAIGPPETFREAKLSPCWPQYKAAAQAEYDGHVELENYSERKSAFWKKYSEGQVDFHRQEGRRWKSLKI